MIGFVLLCGSAHARAHSKCVLICVRARGSAHAREHARAHPSLRQSRGFQERIVRERVPPAQVIRIAYACTRAFRSISNIPVRVSRGIVDYLDVSCLCVRVCADEIGIRVYAFVFWVARWRLCLRSQVFDLNRFAAARALESVYFCDGINLIEIFTSLCVCCMCVHVHNLHKNR